MFVPSVGNSQKSLKIGLLLADRIYDSVSERHGHFQHMFHKFLSLAGNIETVPFDVFSKGELPPSSEVETFDGFIVTGSKYSALDKFPWIARLEDTIREYDRRQIRMVGCCFGHQIISKALGGTVEPNPYGWSIGWVPCSALSPTARILFKCSQIDLLYFHRDHVCELPSDMISLGHTHTTKVVGSAKRHSKFLKLECPNEREKLLKELTVITTQGHPEFCADIIERLLEIRKTSFSEETIIRAKSALHHQAHSVEMARLFVDFFSADKENVDNYARNNNNSSPSVHLPKGNTVSESF